MKDICTYTCLVLSKESGSFRPRYGYTYIVNTPGTAQHKFISVTSSHHHILLDHGHPIGTVPLYHHQEKTSNPDIDLGNPNWKFETGK